MIKTETKIMTDLACFLKTRTKQILKILEKGS